MTHDDRSSLYLQEADKSILYHLFLPCYLPSSEEDDFLIQHDHENEHEILKCMEDFFQSSHGTHGLPISSIITKCIKNWSNLQNPKNWTVFNLQSTIQRLNPGEFFSLYFHSQNAAILIEMDENNNNQPLISSWQVLLPTQKITSSLTPHLSRFPMSTYRVHHRSQLSTRPHCELLIDFMKNTIEHSKSYKAGNTFNETRNISESHYVFQWWITQFQGITMENNINTCEKFKKKHRDHIRWERALIPFRRSGLWKTIKVVLHAILTKRLKDFGTIVYKLLITHFLAYVIYTRHSSASTELLVHCLRKIARRLNKIDVLLSNTDSSDMHEWILYTKQDIQSKLQEILPKSEWQQSIKAHEDTNQKLSVNNLNLNDSKIYRHSCEELEKYLKMNDSPSSQPQYTGVNNSLNSTVAAINEINDVPSFEVLTNRLNYTVATALTRTEIWVEFHLNQWINRPLSAVNAENRFETLLDFFKNYQNNALNHYRSAPNSSDPIGYSRFILTSLTIIRCMHQNLCQDKRFERLKLHSIHIPNIIQLFEYLILPNHDDMVRAYELYHYFSQFKNNQYPDLLSDIKSEHAFGTYFANCSETMKICLQEIRAQSEQDKEAKREEMRVAKERYRRLMDSVRSLKCECTYHYYRRNYERNKCYKCRTEMEAENIKVAIYECPIPSKRNSALAVIFELQMPIEIRCYREVFWQFINRLSPRSSHGIYVWLEVPPHKDKLKRYYTGPPNTNVKLVSSAKSLIQSHYSDGRLVKDMSLSPDDFLFKNSLKVEISPNETIRFENECGILTPQLTDANYTHLQFTVNNTEFAQNRVIAKLSDCPLRMKRTQFTEFGSFRSGHALQWLNLLSILEMESLPIEEESVVILIAHSLLQYGPLTEIQKTFENSWCSEAHRLILEDHIVDELISRLSHRLDDCKFNWQNELVLIVITIITMRILTICNLTRECQAADLALKCRQTGETWLDLISESIQTTSSLNIDAIGKLRIKIATIGIACQITYSVHPVRTHLVLSTNEHIISLLKAITTVYDNMTLNKNQINMSSFMNHMVRFSERVLVSIQPTLAELLKKLSYQSLNNFSTIYCAVLNSAGIMNGNWKKRTTDVYDGLYDGQYHTVRISIDCLKGTFLVNGMTSGFLPEKITSSNLFLRVFECHIFEVQADELPNTYITKRTYHGACNVRYTFHIDSCTNRITISEQHEKENDRFQLISHDCFLKELPDALVSNCSHWRNTKNQQIEFRPVRFRDPNFLKEKTYILTAESGCVTTTNETQVLVPQSSLLFQNLYKRYFNRLDDEPYVYMLRDKAAHINEKPSPQSDIIIHIYLSRLGIAFTYDAKIGTITSREYSDMCIAEDQWLGTLTGLQFGLLLSPMSASNVKCQSNQCRKLIVPFGEIHTENNRYSNHQIVTIKRTVSFHQYFAFNLNDRLHIIQSTDSPTGWLYLALLHAMTSHPLPDQYTGMTGMERSFQLLQSAGCWSDQPFDELSLNILYQIAAISPTVAYYPPHSTIMEKIDWKKQKLPYSMQHFGYYLMVQKLLHTSQQLNFMYPSSVSTRTQALTGSNKNNERLLEKLYWDYRDSYNPTARLSKEMEDEIFRTSSSTPYQSTLMNCSSSSNYSPVDLKNDMYMSGSINLKDTSELDYFPLSKWLGNEFNLQTIWIGLLKKASCSATRNNKDETEQFEMFLDFLHYISTKTQIQSFYLQMLRTVLKTPAIALKSDIFPEFGRYENIEQVSVQEKFISFKYDCSDDQKNTIIAEIKKCFEKESDFTNTDAEKFLCTSISEINRLLKSWQSNKTLRSFLELVQNQICCGTKIWLLNSRISVNPQDFTLESIQDHRRIKFKLISESLDPKLISSSQQKFLHRSSANLVESIRPIEVNRSQNEFPDQIFPSIDNRENPLCDIASHFKNQLHDSWEQFLQNIQYDKKYPSREETDRLLESSRTESGQFWDELIKSIKLPNELLVETGVLSRIVPTILISILLKMWLSEKEQQQNRTESESDISLTKDQRVLLGGTIVNWIFEQQMERASHFSKSERPEDFQKEISNLPHTNWIPSDHLPWLILELEMNITIREIQVEVAYHMMQSNTTITDNKVRNIVMQMNMGEGKTSVIIPMLALSLCSSSSSLVRIVVLKSLFTINYQSLRFKLGGLLNRRIFPFACRRNMNFSDDQLIQIRRRFEQGLRMFDIILTSPEYILSFDLLTIDKCRRNEWNNSRSMLNMQKWLKQYVRDVLDESDEILHVKYQLVYTVGDQESVDGGAERWKITQTVLQLVKKHARTISDRFRENVCYKSNERKSAFPQFRLLSIDPFSALCKEIANDWLSGKYREHDQQRISSFILDPDRSIEDLNNQFPPNTVKLFLTLRGLLSSEVLFVALKKRHRVNFGVNENPDFHRLMAVPFRAKDVVAENTEFGHSDVAIVLTQLSYYYSGLNDSQMKQCCNRLTQEESDPALIYDQWISDDDKNDVHHSVQQWKGVNLNDHHQRTQYLFPILRYNMLLIDYFLDHFVFPREAKQFPFKLVASAWDLSSSARSQIITGFSGTNDTQLLLPVSIRQCDLPKLQKTDALVVNNLLQPENEMYQNLPTDASSDDILKEIINYKLYIQVILDVGALFIDGTNREIAVKWLNLSDKSKIDYAVYFELDSIVACDRQFRHHPFLTSPASERLDHCVIYLDEIHTRGSDFKFPKGFRAAVTLGHGLTKDRLVQAAMRMRQLGNGHSLTFWSSNEVHQQIHVLKKDVQQQNTNVSKHNDQITLLDLLRWVYNNTQQATWDGLHHWAAQSLSFQRKMAAYRDIQWADLQQPFTDIMIKRLAEICLEAEVIELQQMYGGRKQLQITDSIYSTRYKRLEISSSVEIHNDVLKQLKKYGGSKKRMAQLLDEEQERELEQELEEERQMERPPRVDPCEPILHKEIEELCNIQGDMLNLAQLTKVFCPLVQAFTGTTFFNDCQSTSWRRNFWISTEFQRVIQTSVESLNSFLRPPRWVVVYREQHIIFVSAFEANWLINHLNSLYHKNAFRSSPNTTLRLWVPRLKHLQSILVNTPALTIPPTITSDNRLTAFNIPLEWLMELFTFNGTLYFENINEQNAYCKCLGLCPKPRSPIEDQAFEKGLIASDGFVSDAKYRSRLHVGKCCFKTSPLSLISRIIESRNNSYAPLVSHVGSIIYNQLKLL